MESPSPKGRRTNGRPGSPAHAPNGTIDPRSPRLGDGGLGRGRPVCGPAGPPRGRGGDGTGQQPIGAGGGLHELGADDVVSDVDQLRGRVDLILESIGGETLGRLVTKVDPPQGTLIMFGNSSDEPTTFNVRAVYNDALVPELPREEITEAMDRLKNRDVAGKVALTLGEPAGSRCGWPAAGTIRLVAKRMKRRSPRRAAGRATDREVSIAVAVLVSDGGRVRASSGDHAHARLPEPEGVAQANRSRAAPKS